MKTDELIGILGQSFEREPVRDTHMIRGIGLATAAGAAGALCLALIALGLRPDLAGYKALAFLALKVIFAVAVGGFAIHYLGKAARPGGERSVRPWVAALPFAAITVLAAASLALAPPEHWHAMVAGHTWLECLLSIPVIAVVPFAIITWAVRRIGAPTDLVLTGALVGLASGSASAVGYALHCMDDTLPFVAVWYGGTIALCTLTGAMLGPRLFRW